MLRYISVGVLALVLVVSFSGMAAHTSTEGMDFVLTVDQHPDAAASGKEMLQDAHGGGGVVELTTDKQCQLWSSDEPAAVDLSFPAQTVSYQLDTLVGDLVTLTVSVGVVSDNVYTAIDGVRGDGAAGTIDLADGMAVDAGEYVGFQVCADFEGVASSIDISTQDGASLVTFQDSPPPTYPTPELGTLLLSGIGLLGIVGMNRIRTRR